MEDRMHKQGQRQLRIQSAPQAAAQAIREAIISGALRGGDRIIELKWARRLGIGQPTLREACMNWSTRDFCTSSSNAAPT